MRSLIYTPKLIKKIGDDEVLISMMSFSEYH